LPAPGTTRPVHRDRRILADLSARDAIVAILAQLGLPMEAPPFARARSPSFDAA
jgi:hypothetical protein